MTANASCTRTPLSGSPIDTFIQRYIFPVQATGTVIVSAIVAYQLLRRHLRNVGRLHIIVLSLLQLVMIACSLPHALAGLETFYTSEFFRRWNFLSLVPISFVMNYASAADTFLCTLVAVQFCLFARDAQSKKMFSSLKRQVIVVVAVFVAVLPVTIHALLSHSIKLFTTCGGEVTRFQMKVNFTPGVMRAFELVQALAVIVIPTMVFVICNARLLRTIASQLPSTHECKELISGSSSSEASPSDTKLRRSIKALTAVFVITHVLSVAPFVAKYLLPPAYLPMLYTVIPVASSITLTGKLVTFTLLHDVSIRLARIGVVNFF